MPSWVLPCLLALVFWGGWAVLPKALPAGMSGFRAQALSTVGLLPILLVLGLSGKLSEGASPPKGAAIAFLAGFFSAGGNVAYYQALSKGAKAMTVAPLTALYPLVTIGLAMVFLGETPNLVQAGGIAVALGAIVLFNPLKGQTDWGSAGACALLAFLLWGTAGLLQKICTNHASSETAAFWFHAAFLPSAGFILLGTRSIGRGLSLKTWSILLLLGLLFGLGNVFLLVAFARGGKAAIVTPLSGLYSVVAIPLAMLFGERAGRREVVGIALAILAVVALTWEGKEAA